MSQGAKEYQDVRAAALYLKKNISRVGIWGISYGGLNTLQAVTRDPQLFAAGVSGAGIFNWISELRYFTDTGASTYHLDLQPPLPNHWRALTVGPLPHLAGPGWAADVHSRLDLVFSSSPVAHVSNRTSPLLLIQGDADEEVSFEETVGCVRALRSFGIDPETLVIPDESHGIGAYTNQLVAHEAMASFFEQHL
uniref:Peptidase S9 prolyl oligopeptidase catalytic domain-containing protein n=1 Tax=Haptolina ericina TaxID=156174 RepID=A0A7S3BYT6_9EUKA